MAHLVSSAASVPAEIPVDLQNGRIGYVYSVVNDAIAQVYVPYKRDNIVRPQQIVNAQYALYWAHEVVCLSKGSCVKILDQHLQSGQTYYNLHFALTPEVFSRQRSYYPNGALCTEKIEAKRRLTYYMDGTQRSCEEYKDGRWQELSI